MNRPRSRLLKLGGYILIGLVVLICLSATAAWVLYTRSDQAACYGLTDLEVFESIQRAYANDSYIAASKGRQTSVDKARVVGVEREGTKGEDAFVGMLFRQDNGGILGIRLFEDCTFHTSPSRTDDVANWAYPLSSPKI